MPRAEEEESGASANAGAQGARGASQSGKGGQSAKAAQPAAGQDDPVAMLKQDHRKVEALLGEFEKADEARKAALVKEVCQALIVHAELEEKLFYPAAREAAGEDKLSEAQVEHDAQKVLILELMEANGADEYRNAKFKVLGEEVKQHVKEEEAPDGVLAKAEKAGVATAELAERMAQMKAQLLERAQAGRLPQPRPVSLRRFGERSRQETRMARQSTSRERDEYGRFVSDDDEDRGRRRDRDDDERGYRSRSFEERDRDERGRFTREDDDDRRYSSRGGGSRDRGQGGWFGDAEGHSEASRRGWDEREREGRTSRSYRDDDDDRRYSSRERDRDRDRGQGGWFGDPEGHSEASRRGWDEREREGRTSRSSRDDDERRYSSRGRGQGGWFGDPEGHSEASRRGWDEREDEGRGRSRSEERSYASRRRDDDDDDDDRGRGSRGRGGGGWSGDPEGHAEAARRGWQNRR